MNEDQFQEKNTLTKISFVDMVAKNRGISPEEFLKMGQNDPGHQQASPTLPVVVEAENELLKFKHAEADRVLPEEQAKLERRRKELGIIDKPLNQEQPTDIIIPVKKAWCEENPLWEPKGSVGLFNEILRSNVFANLPKGKKIHNIDKVIATWAKGLSMKTSGPQLVQLDLGCYMGIRSFFKYDEQNPENQYVFFSLKELTRRMGKKSECSDNRNIQRDSIKRLLEATIYIYSDAEKRELFGGHFIEEFVYDSSKKLYRVKLNLNLIKLNKDGCTWIDLDEWNGLSHGVTRLLYGFLSTHHSSMQHMTTVKLETLLSRFEMKTSFKDFKQKVVKSLNELLEKKVLFFGEVKGNVLYAAKEKGLKQLSATS